MRRWIAATLVLSLLAATSGMAGENAPAPPKPSHRGPLALQITGAAIAGVGTFFVASAAGKDDMDSAITEAAGIVGIGVGVGLFAGGTIWRFTRARSEGRPEATLEIDLLAPAPGLLARASF